MDKDEYCVCYSSSFSPRPSPLNKLTNLIFSYLVKYFFTFKNLTLVSTSQNGLMGWKLRKRGKNAKWGGFEMARQREKGRDERRLSQ